MSPTRVTARAVRAVTRWDSSVWLALTLGAALMWLIAWPLVTMARSSSEAWGDVLTGPLSANLMREPLANTVVVGLGTAVVSTSIGALLAWLVTSTDVRGRRLLGVVAAIPFALPTFALALAWESVFRNDLVGSSRAGLIAQLGLDVPDWLAWGRLPVIATLAAHYSSLAFLLIAATLASAGGDLQEAAELTGASRWRILAAITVPAARPALAASMLLTFAEGASNFSAPALLGTPVRFHTLSTRIYGSISTGRTERGYAVALVLIATAGIALVVGTAIQRRRRSAVLSGKGVRSRRIALGGARLPLSVAAWSVAIATTLLPALVLILTSFSKRTGSFGSGLTLHHWIGSSDPNVAQGQRGILRNPAVLDAMRTTLFVSVMVALVAIVVGVLAAAVIRRSTSALVRATLSALTFVPFLIPGVVLGAVLIGQFGSSFGPIPALYGTPALLILAGAIAGLPYATQAAGASLSLVGPDMEEAATLAGAGFLRRMWRIALPLALRGLVAGAVLSFVKMARDLDLVALVATPTTTTLSVITYRYASEGFTQMANAITVLIVIVSVGVTMLARRVEGRATPWAS